MPKLLSLSKRRRRRSRVKNRATATMPLRHDFKKRDVALTPLRVVTPKLRKGAHDLKEPKLKLKRVKVATKKKDNNNHSHPAKPIDKTDINKRVTICEKRRERRAVLFALNIAGLGGLRPPLWNPTSKVRC